jgi:type IV secretory pathway component VirB8
MNKKNQKQEERATKDLEIDESQLSDEDKKEAGFKGPIGALIVCGIIAVLMIVCIIVIVVLNNAS